MRVGEDVSVVLADSAHDPTDGFSDFPVFVFEHLKKVLESLDHNFKELLFFRTFSD